MKIKSFFHKMDTIFLDKEFSSKDEALKFLSTELELKGYGKDKYAIFNQFKIREQQDSTGVGEGIAIPHLRDDSIDESTLMFARVKPLDWDSIDNKKVTYIFAIAMSKQDGETSHLDVIAKLSKLLINSNFIESLSLIRNKEEFVKTIDFFERKEEKNALEEQKAKEALVNEIEFYDVVAITSCPTGIAHTYLAEERLIQAAKDMGIKIKVETQGAEGPKNVLTQSEIDNAKGVILAIDREVEKQRFENSTNVLEISTKKAISKSKENIEKILENKGTKISIGVKETKDANVESSMSFDGFGKKMFRSMMTGISYMLPFIIFGGIVIALAFLIDMIAGGIAGLDMNSSSFLKSFGSNSAIANWFMSIGGNAMSLAVPILAAYITFSLVGRQGLLPGFVVGLIASGKLAGSYNFLEKSLNNNPVGIEGSDFLGTGSGFVGAILGAFFAAAMLIVFSKYIFGKLPKSLQGTKNILFIPLFATLTIAGVFWVVNIIFIYFNFTLTLFLSLMQNKIYLAWLLGMVLGIMMAIDLGGPINKAAYIFGTLTISNGHSSVAMAAVMAAGMVPPLGISISMIMHKKLWSKEDIEAGKWTNILFGVSFISEGAIPYTSKDAKNLIPANIAGGAVAGIISGLLGVNIIAPHGGIFVMFLAKTSFHGAFTNLGAQIGLGIIFWLLAIIGGAFASAFTYYFMKKYNSREKNNSEKTRKFRNPFSKKIK